MGDNLDFVVFCTVLWCSLTTFVFSGRREEVNFFFFWHKLADNIWSRARNRRFSLFLEWKRAENCNLLLCFKCEMVMERQTRFENLYARWFKWKHHLRLSVLENRREMICCLCSVFCLLSVCSFSQPSPERAATQKHKYVCSSSALSTKQSCVQVG